MRPRVLWPNASGLFRSLSLFGLSMLVASALTPSANAGAPAPPRHLRPGSRAALTERVPVSFVFLGYEPKQVDVAEVRSRLPRVHKPHVRGVRVVGAPLGITYSYHYRFVFTSTSYENRFFSFLRSVAKRADLTDQQQQYNDQERNVVDIRSNVEIPAPSVERWLARHPPAGVDVRQNTLFFINWYGRRDFRFHVYTKYGEPDPDTGTDFGHGERTPVAGSEDGADFNKSIAWGGTTPDDEETGLGVLARIWFHDLSAGPTRRGRNWDVDSPDPEHGRLPPIWEYSPRGFRAPRWLSRDLARVARYIGIDALFTPSPTYSPALTPPRLPRSINIDINVYEGGGAVDASDQFLTPELVLREVSKLQPYNKFSVDVQDLRFNQDSGTCYTLWHAAWYTIEDGWGSCFPGRSYSVFANLFLNAALNQSLWRDSSRSDYELGSFVYSTPGIAPLGVGGYADDNWREGTQSVVHVWSHPILTEFGYGMTLLLIHEIGHHLGLSHTYDGYDSDHGDYADSEAAFTFVAVGRHVNSPMGDLVNADFSQFDRDNMNRWMTSAFVTQANAIAELIWSGRGRVANAIAAADRAVGTAKSRFAAHRYVDARRAAMEAYDLLRSAARKLRIDVVGDRSGMYVEGPSTNSAPDQGRPKIDHFGPSS